MKREHVVGLGPLLTGLVGVREYSRCRDYIGIRFPYALLVGNKGIYYVGTIKGTYSLMPYCAPIRLRKLWIIRPSKSTSSPFPSNQWALSKIRAPAFVP